MDRGLYIAASGMLAEQVRQSQIANDLANASTSGYKADRTSQSAFGELLLTNSKTGATIGAQSTAVRVDRVQTDWRPAEVKETGEPLDFAITGDGFFAVQTAAGTRYTRNGQFARSPQGELVTARGDRVLGRDGGPVGVPANGAVDPRRLQVTALTGARKDGDSLVTGRPGPGATGMVRAGALEGSGADPATSMVDMIASMRSFEAGQRVITTIDETLGRASSQVGSMNGN